ncbi:unnamed protein product [Thelazia callipaeda]|uniref:DUF727 domain-containing protein n=1 Tax=Thelazia callipaeda TaxID=103827 RepID=A0A0N5CXD2_THECL|nr:unnamed protein product [Thelazia callipaeda]
MNTSHGQNMGSPLKENNDGREGRRISVSSTDSSDMLNDLSERCADFGLSTSLLEKEAFAAIHEVGFAVQMISMPKSLPRSPNLIFMNLITLEGFMYCIELTQRGWRIASDRLDSIGNECRKRESYTRYFETINQLLNVISPEFRNQFAKKLSTKLSALASEISGFKST